MPLTIYFTVAELIGFSEPQVHETCKIDKIFIVMIVANTCLVYSLFQMSS